MAMMVDRSGERVLGVLAGGDGSIDWLGRWAKSADRVVAADGAANRLVEAGVHPHIAIGDFDSIDDVDHGFERIYVDDQDCSDCDKLVRYLAQSGVTAATFVGVEGDRPDHVLASLFSLSQAPFAARIAFRTGFGWIVRAGEALSVSTELNGLISFLPLETCLGVRFEGVRWPLIDATVDSAHVSLSNRAQSDFASVRLTQGTGMLFVEGDSEPNWS